MHTWDSTSDARYQIGTAAGPSSAPCFLLKAPFEILGTDLLLSDPAYYAHGNSETICAGSGGCQSTKNPNTFQTRRGYNKNITTGEVWLLIPRNRVLIALR
jgi:hypothetical protein